MTGAAELQTITWPTARLGEAIEALARHANLLPRPANAPPAPAGLANADEHTLAQWVELVANQLDIEAEPVEINYTDVEAFVRGAAPALVELPPTDADTEENSRWLICLKNKGQRITLITPDFSTQTVEARLIRDALCRPLETPFIETTEQVLAQAGVPEERRARVRKMILAEQLSGHQIGHGWLLRLSPGGPYWQRLRETRVIPFAAIIVGLSLLRQGLTAVTWVMIGRGAFEGHFDWAWLWAWALLTLMDIPLQMLVSTAGARLGTNVGGAFKTTLLYGALKLHPEEIRHEGTGQFLSRIMDANVVEYGTVGSALTMVFSIIQVFTALAVLRFGAGGWVSVIMLVFVIVATVALGFEFWRGNDIWVDTYRRMTNHLVERMVGHRTRLAQEEAARWHVEEDAELAGYTQLTERQTRLGNWLAALPRVWMILGLASIVGGFVGQMASPEIIAVSLGGILMGQQALNAINTNIRSFVSLTKSWQQIKPLFEAAKRANDFGFVISALGFSNQLPSNGHPPSENSAPLITMRDVSFRYQDRGRLALNEATLHINNGDRLLVEGPSGGGKSTLAAVMAGLRVPESGLLLLRGYDRASVGLDTWRKRVVVAPQFHENHVFTDTFGFNLLMGRRWPPTPEDGIEALEICNELGLGELIERMPSGTQQIVGESGWQLSHGERSRLYIARALLQRADLIILDESFAALDPENLAGALQCVLNRAPTLLVIAHP